jgi:CheY-like chemotaxis protein
MIRRKGAGDARIAWVVEDNEKSLADVAKTMRQAGLRVREIPTQERFVEILATVGTIETSPDIVILDLRLPWAAPAALADNAISGGLDCLQLLRQEPSTSNVPVVIFSAFVHDDLINSQLLAYQPLSLVDKLEPDRLRLVVENLLPSRRLDVVDQLSRMGTMGERRLLRLAAIIGALTTIVTLIVLLLRLIL